MARRSRGLGAGSKTSLRPFTQLLKHLGPAERGRLESAFSDAEDLLSFHSASIPERLQKRRISGLVKQIEISVTASTLGAFVSWPRPSDAKISLYKIQVSDDSVFSSPETFTSVDTFFAVEGASTVKFIRVRGVRLDGEAGVWSETSSAVPNITAQAAFSAEFYPLYVDGEDPSVQRTVVYGGDTDPEAIPTFYTLLADSFYADRLTGGLSIWGYVSNRLRRFTDPGKTPWDRVRFTVNGIHRMDTYFPHWTNAFSETSANATDKDSTGKFITFYAKGGYTASFGPYGINTPNALAGFGPQDAGRVTTQDAPNGTFYWDFPLNARFPSRFDEAQLLSFSAATPAHEAAAPNIENTKKTHYLVFQNFKINVPSTSRIVGIQADVKRRQPNQRDDEIAVNLGNRRPDKILGDDLVLEHMATAPSASNVTSANILEDVNFGKYLDLTAGKGGSLAGRNSGRLAGDPGGVGDNGLLAADRTTTLDTGTTFSISAWIIAPSNPIATTSDIVGTLNALGNSAVTLSLITSTTAITTYTFRVFHEGAAGTASFTATGATRNLNAFHHVVGTWDKNGGPNGESKLYVDGVLRTTTLPGSAIMRGFNVETPRQLAVGTSTSGIELGNSLLGQAQTGLWSKKLTPVEVEEL